MRNYFYNLPLDLQQYILDINERARIATLVALRHTNMKNGYKSLYEDIMERRGRKCAYEAAHSKIRPYDPLTDTYHLSGLGKRRMNDVNSYWRNIGTKRHPDDRGPSFF